VIQPLFTSTAACLTSTLTQSQNVKTLFKVSLPYYLQMAVNPTFSHPQDWRQTHLGRLLGHAMRGFDSRVLH
jgi:hypothetical protein